MAVFKPLSTPCGIFNDLNLTASVINGVTLYDNWNCHNIVSPYSKLYYIKNGGGGWMSSGNEHIELKPNHIYLIPVATNHDYYLKDSSPENPLEKIYAHFNLKEPSGYDLLRNIRKILVLPCTKEYLEEMYSLLHSKRLIDSLALKTNMLRDIIKMISAEAVAIDTQRKYSDKIQAALKMVSQNPSIQMNAKSIAKELFVSESYLIKKFKQEVGVTLGNYIDEMIMFSAQVALSDTSDSIAEISERLGFNDKYYFSKRFKLLYGETPAHYRKRLQMYTE